MASEVEIVNVALTLLGEARILSLDDDVKPAREAKAIFTSQRDKLLAAYNWSFAKTRAQLSADATAPAFEWDYAYTMPAECLRLLQVGDEYAGIDLTDYRGANTALFTIEGRKILTSLGAPLNIRYVQRITDTTMFHVCFNELLSARLAEELCEPLTQSDSKRARAIEFRKESLRDAIRANAIELPPQKLADDEWVMSRL
jgi:hypothetical protein